ncbi:hypothetical protein [Streptococcus pluranimalium]|uniref:hypothetical protein n=1 Tax=Streptococcus pluranimalium TaxID=82348 RepID=UPI0039FD2013
MIQELNLSPFWLAVVFVITLWLIYQIAKTPSKIEPIEGKKEQENKTEPEYLVRYGAVIQMQGR